MSPTTRLRSRPQPRREARPHRRRGPPVRAKALENLGADHLEEAMTAYERSVALGPAGLRSRTALADLLRRAGRSEETETIRALLKAGLRELVTGGDAASD